MNEHDRRQVKQLYWLDSGNCRDASQQWKQQPTTIPTPKNLPNSAHAIQQRPQLEPGKGGSPWNGMSSMGNIPHVRGGNKTAKQTVASNTIPNKRRKVTHPDDKPLTFVKGRGTVLNSARSHQPMAASNADIIQIDSDDEDIGESAPNYPNPLNSASAESFRNERSHPLQQRYLDVPGSLGFLGASSNPPGNLPSLPVRSGQKTEALRKKFAGEIDSDLISESSVSPNPMVDKFLPRGLHVKTIAEGYENRTKVQRLDLKMFQPTIKNNMKGNSKSHSRMGTKGGTTEKFRKLMRPKAPSSQFSLNKEIRLRIEEWFFGLSRRNGGTECHLTCKRNGLDIHANAEDITITPENIRSVEYTEGSEEFQVFTIFPRSLPSEPKSAWFTPGDSKSGKIVIKLDVRAAGAAAYKNLLAWIKSNNIESQVVRGSAATRAIWETAEAKETFQMASTRARREEKPSSIHPDNDIIVKDSAPEDYPAGELLKPTLNTYNTHSSTQAMANDELPARLRRSARHHAPPSPPRLLASDPDEVILCYPHRTPGAVNITIGDYNRLQPGEFLNDTLIEFGLKWWLKQLEESHPELASQIHVFSSFFYKKLNKKNIDESYNSVRKWTAKIDLFSKKYIIVPINEHLHWYLVIIYQPAHMLIPAPPISSPSTRNRRRIFLETSAKATSGGETSEKIQEAPTPTKRPSATKTSTPINSVASSEAEVEDAVMNDIVSTVGAQELREDITMSPDSPLEAEVDWSGNPDATMSPTGSADGPRDRWPSCDIEMSDIATSSSTRHDGRSLFDIDGDGKPTSLSTTIPASRFYGKLSQKALGKQRAIPNQAIAFKDNDAEDELAFLDVDFEKRTYIFTLDSLGSRHPQAIKQLSSYLKKEARDKLGKTDTSDAVGKQAQVPVQPNFCDCGLYLLHFAETFMSDPQKYCQLIKARGKRTANKTREEEWKGELTVDMRERLRSNIDKLSAEWKQNRAAREESKRKENMESIASTTPDDISDDEVDIVETVPDADSNLSAKTGRKAPVKGRAIRPRA